ncbi:uncharacterized protein BO96DRAFT_435844 [Aspergillus niger CBS 101883]|uniref:Uncharacterized protein n=3 Tax=Aspergillus niger TaxID=5061 RepID=A5AB25_ASPNC|nr:uncharacterized protein BO96DRAFT_435844 [Aspergillus niger CBS 101883]XP_059606171.1 hypothetical protein An08g08790 [Aspergillus niger]PYH54650.1 hypothetical protein BO96DRAFT_435844 [Aspergillus niger CBS 101883]RDH18557.1 hypothetical protein M747DRAFT_316366 [Aspergillus niger ATCC 13496]CAK96659.1 hypothetical protein An08g08790 [Aspergillus niger]
MPEEVTANLKGVWEAKPGVCCCHDIMMEGVDGVRGDLVVMHGCDVHFHTAYRFGHRKYRAEWGQLRALPAGQSESTTIPAASCPSGTVLVPATDVGYHQGYIPIAKMEDKKYRRLTRVGGGTTTTAKNDALLDLFAIATHTHTHSHTIMQVLPAGRYSPSCNPNGSPRPEMLDFPTTRNARPGLELAHPNHGDTEGGQFTVQNQGVSQPGLGKAESGLGTPRPSLQSAAEKNDNEGKMSEIFHGKYTKKNVMSGCVPLEGEEGKVSGDDDDEDFLRHPVDPPRSALFLVHASDLAAGNRGLPVTGQDTFSYPPKKVPTFPVPEPWGYLGLCRAKPRPGGMGLTAWCLAPLVPIRSLPL